MKVKIDWKTCLRVGISIFVLYLAIHYWTATASIIKTFLSAVLPLIIGAVIAYPLNILMGFFERHVFSKAKNPKLLKMKNGLCLLLTVATLIIIVFTISL